MAVFAVEALADGKRQAGGIRELIHKRIVMFDTQAAPSCIIGVRPTGILLGIFRAHGKSSDFLARRDGGSERDRSRRDEVLQIHVDCDRHISMLEVFDEKLRFAILFLAGNADQLLFAGEEGAANNGESYSKCYYAP